MAGQYYPPTWPPPIAPTIPVPTNGDTIVYSITLEDSRNEGVLAMPVYAVPPAVALPASTQLYAPSAPVPTVAPAPTPCKIVRLHAPVETYTVHWEARRQGGCPQVPSPNSLDANLVPLASWRGRPTPVSDKVGLNKIWSIAGFYTYAKVAPEGMDSDMVGSKYPWDMVDVSTNIIPAAQVYRQDLVGVPAPPFPNLLNPITTGPVTAGS